MAKTTDKFIDFGTGDKQVSSRDLPADFTPSNYTPAQAGSDGNDKVSAHLKGVDSALALLTGGFGFYEKIGRSSITGIPNLTNTYLFNKVYPAGEYLVIVNTINTCTRSAYDGARAQFYTYLSSNLGHMCDSWDQNEQGTSSKSISKTHSLVSYVKDLVNPITISCYVNFNFDGSVTDRSAEFAAYILKKGL